MLLSFFLLSTVGVAGLSAAGITSALAALGAILGGGMVGGIFFIGLLIAIPPLVVGIVYFSIREYKFKSEKDSLYKEAIKKQQAIIRALQEEQDASKERIEYLNELNILLRRIIKELREDQGEYGAA